MQMYPGAGFKEHHYMVEKDDYMFSDDFHFNKNSAMHSNKGEHLNYGGPNHNILHQHPMMRPVDHNKPNHNMHLPMMRPIDHNKPNHNMHLPMMRPVDHCKPNHFGYNKPNHFGYNKHGVGGGNYAETFYEQQEEKQFYENSYGQFDRGAHNRVPATWDCKGIDD
ncbi:4-hydroxy-2-oxovalerate aldolase 2 [Striga asiatica]|uniref:4-hydroxy-2-oxovalerate aldolase 2 n=1 Tax=Striga asiatica TaxID=4170 RepID=A0A5A7RFQ9_STRAF|nr:4-hydroxy-2-oxovalerate aldolase 2 [Striga asiatica]